jgi:transposase InsO family protein
MQHQRKFPVEKMCKVFNVSRSGYYYWLSAPVSARSKKNQELLVEIREVFRQSDSTYGSPRVCRELEALGIQVSRPRVARLMQAAKLRAVRGKCFKVTTNSKHSYPVSPNLLNQQFKVDRKNKVWVSDITYIKTTQGWLYLTVIIDLYNRKVVGWALSETMKYEDTVCKAWQMAIAGQEINGTLIFHSDRGVQYACSEFRKELAKLGSLVRQSMSRKGNCWDNAVAESFFKSLKVECVYRQKYSQRSQASMDIFHWIEAWYNRKRRHSALDGLSIEEFEKNIINQKMAA